MSICVIRRCLFSNFSFVSKTKQLNVMRRFQSSNVAAEYKSVSPSQVYDKVEDMLELTKGDPELEKKLRILCLEYEVMKQEGANVPSTLKLDQWKELFAMETRSKRSKFLRFLFLNEMKKLNDKARKEKRSLEALERRQSKLQEAEQNEHINYGLRWNTFFLRVYDTTINHMYNNKLIQAMQFGQKIVFDCDYDANMSKQEATNCAKQINISFSENRAHRDPFDIHLCNARKDGHTMQQLNKIIPNVYDTHFPLNISEKSYLDLFPKEKLVYLTPHCRTELHEFDHDAVYVVGALVDKRNNEPLSLAKAKREGIKMAKFPLDRYLQWGEGSGKSLTLNQVINVMLDLRWKEEWEFALRHVPRRKLFQNDPFTSQPKTSMVKKTFKNLNWGTNEKEESRRENTIQGRRDNFSNQNKWGGPPPVPFVPVKY